MFLTSKSLVFSLFIVIISFFEGSTIKTNAIREGPKPKGRDYRPSKWIANSAMDVWYGNKTMIDIAWREFSDFMYKLTDRDTRAVHYPEAEWEVIQSNDTVTLIDDLLDSKSGKRQNNDSTLSRQPLNTTSSKSDWEEA